MNTIIFTVIVALVIGFALGILLGLFKKLFAVQADPKVAQIREALPGANCGGCGYAGCDAFAEAVAKGEAPATGCVAGGSGVLAAISAALGVATEGTEKKAAFLLCQGSDTCAKPRGVYNGIKSCRAAQIVLGGLKACAFGCIGLGDCQEACPFGAISMQDGIPKVDCGKCVGCGKCVAACPKKLFTLIPTERRGAIALCSCYSDNKPQIRKDCTAGCFKCGMCARKCPEKCIDVSSGIPQIDYAKCTSCGTCVSSCPDKVLKLIEAISSPA